MSQAKKDQPSLWERLCGHRSIVEEDEVDDTQQKNTVVGILQESGYGGEIDSLRDDEVEWMFLTVEASLFEKLERLDCFEDSGGIDYRNARRFISRNRSVVDVSLQIVDTEETFKIELHNVQVSGDAVTNDVIMSFCETCGRCIGRTFDPLAENHDEPILSLNVF